MALLLTRTGGGGVGSNFFLRRMRRQHLVRQWQVVRIGLAGVWAVVVGANHLFMGIAAAEWCTVAGVGPVVGEGVALGLVHLQTLEIVVDDPGAKVTEVARGNLSIGHHEDDRLLWLSFRVVI